ncbi:hypothetical protein KI387_025912, partial [Taxus chinensis]
MKLAAAAEAEGVCTVLGGGGCGILRRRGSKSWRICKRNLLKQNRLKANFRLQNWPPTGHGSREYLLSGHS